MQSKVRVGVLFGGRSGEHAVSLRSARSVMEAIDRERYDVVPIGISQQGRWLVGGDPMATLAGGDGPGLAAAEPSDRLPPASLLAGLDVVFPVLHGTFGEDGTVQGLLDVAGIPYVGAGVMASAVAMDKVLFKDVARTHDLPTVAHLALNRRRWEEEPEVVLDEVGSRFEYPVFTKPANLGSSVGIGKCKDREALRAGLDEAARWDRRLLIEEAVPTAREIEVSVLGNDRPEASVPGEIRSSREFYDYAAKYLDEGDHASQLLIPAPLDRERTERVRDLALRAYRAVDCTGLARVDFLVDGRGGAIFLNELNTMPGFTSISMYPKLWAETGIPYPELITRLIELAFERHDDRQRTQTVYRPVS